MIPSIDNYLKKEVTRVLDIILHECYIIDEVLRDFDTDVVDTFKKAYCGEDPKNEITVRFSFPDVKTPLLASYVIQLGEGSETNDSLGGVEGTFSYKEDGYEDEICTVIQDNQTPRLYLEVSKNIGTYLGSRDISFAESDNIEIEGNKLYFESQGNEHLVGVALNVQYSSKFESINEEDPSGTHRGFTANETLNITSVSTNVDTVRCMDAILKVIMIMLRQSPQEQNYYSLQKVRFSPLAPVINNGDTVVHGRTVTLGYRVSYSVEYNVANKIKEIVLREVIKNGKKNKGTSS